MAGRGLGLYPPRPDVTFSLLTKRAERILNHLPADWGDGWDHVQFAVSCENQRRVEERIPYLLEVPREIAPLF